MAFLGRRQPFPPHLPSTQRIVLFPPAAMPFQMDAPGGASEAVVGVAWLLSPPAGPTVIPWTWVPILGPILAQ